MLLLKMPHNIPTTILKEVKTRTEVTIIIVTSKGRTLGKIKRKIKKRQLLAPMSNLNLVNNKIGTTEVGRTTIVEATITNTAIMVALFKVAVIMIVTTMTMMISSSTLTKTTPS